MGHYIYFITDDSTVPTENTAKEVVKDLMKWSKKKLGLYTFRYGPDVNDPTKLHDELVAAETSAIQIIFINKEKGKIGVLDSEFIPIFIDTLLDKNKNITSGQLLKQLLIDMGAE